MRRTGQRRVPRLFLHAARVLVLIALHKMTRSVAPRVNTWVLVFHRRDRLEKSPAVRGPVAVKRRRRPIGGFN